MSSRAGVGREATAIVRPPPLPDRVHSPSERPESVSKIRRMADPPSSESDTRGTVVIVAIFGGLVAAGWLAFFFGLFLPRNTP